jgi:hypothetical protein
VALLEIGGDQSEALGRLAAEVLPGWICQFHADLGGSPRVAQLEPARE